MSEPRSNPGSDCAADGHCITCSDEGVPMKVLALGLEPGTALCRDDFGKAHEVLTDLVGAVKYGDYLLVHAGVALLRLTPPAAPQVQSAERNSRHSVERQEGRA